MLLSVVDELGIESGDILFVHASLDRYGAGAPEAILLIDKLRRTIGEHGSLFMPSYAWSGPDMVPEGPAVFDVRRTPARVGLLAEVFRRAPDVQRSEHYYLPICGIGPHAAAMLADQIGVTEPFGPESTLARLAGHERTKLVGLGVSLNTTSLVHVADQALYRRYPFSFFAPEPLFGNVVRTDGTTCTTSTAVLQPNLRKCFRPARLFERSPALRNALHRHDLGSIINFAYPAKLYIDEAIRIGGDALQAGDLPPWVELGR